MTRSKWDIASFSFLFREKRADCTGSQNLNCFLTPFPGVARLLQEPPHAGTATVEVTLYCPAIGRPVEAE